MAKAQSAVGCSDGTYIYTQTTGAVTVENENNKIPHYAQFPRIYIKNWPGDNCGIPRDIVNSYPTRPSNKNPNGKCVIYNGNYGSRQLTYKPSDNTCVELPIDDYSSLIVLATAAIGAYFISKKGILA